jgi:hypothetical protein
MHYHALWNILFCFPWTSPCFMEVKQLDWKKTYSYLDFSCYSPLIQNKSYFLKLLLEYALYSDLWCFLKVLFGIRIVYLFLAQRWHSHILLLISATRYDHGFKWFYAVSLYEKNIGPLVYLNDYFISDILSLWSSCSRNMTVLQNQNGLVFILI